MNKWTVFQFFLTLFGNLMQFLSDFINFFGVCCFPKHII